MYAAQLVANSGIGSKREMQFESPDGPAKKKQKVKCEKLIDKGGGDPSIWAKESHYDPNDKEQQKRIHDSLRSWYDSIKPSDTNRSNRQVMALIKPKPTETQESFIFIQKIPNKSIETIGHRVNKEDKCYGIIRFNWEEAFFMYMTGSIEFYFEWTTPVQATQEKLIICSLLPFQSNYNFAHWECYCQLKIHAFIVRRPEEAKIANFEDKLGGPEGVSLEKDPAEPESAILNNTDSLDNGGSIPPTHAITPTIDKQLSETQAPDQKAETLPACNNSLANTNKTDATRQENMRYSPRNFYKEVQYLEDYWENNKEGCDYCVYKPNSKFSKRNPGVADYSLQVRSGNNSLPVWDSLYLHNILSAPSQCAQKLLALGAETNPYFLTVSLPNTCMLVKPPVRSKNKYKKKVKFPK